MDRDGEVLITGKETGSSPLYWHHIQWNTWARVQPPFQSICNFINIHFEEISLLYSWCSTQPIRLYLETEFWALMSHGRVTGGKG